MLVISGVISRDVPLSFIRSLALSEEIMASVTVTTDFAATFLNFRSR